jgi:hypothetical protein
MGPSRHLRSSLHLTRWQKKRSIFSTIASKWGVDKAEVRLNGCGFGRFVSVPLRMSLNRKEGRIMVNGVYVYGTAAHLA